MTPALIAMLDAQLLQISRGVLDCAIVDISEGWNLGPAWHTRLSVS